MTTPSRSGCVRNSCSISGGTQGPSDPHHATASSRALRPVTQCAAPPFGGAPAYQPSTDKIGFPSLPMIFMSVRVEWLSGATDDSEGKLVRLLQVVLGNAQQAQLGLRHSRP